MPQQNDEQFEVKVFEYAGSFAENKDKAKDLREKVILPKLKNGSILILDYDQVETTTQSFTHALISESIRIYGSDVLDRILFKNCNDEVERIIGIVVEYMQGNMESPISEE